MSRASLDKQPADVASMFDTVASRYDLTNDVLSLGQDRLWRKATVAACAALPGQRVLDIAAGTGTSSEPFADRGIDVVPADFSLGMLRVGKRRRPDLTFTAADALRLPFADDSADESLLVVPEVLIGRRGDRTWLTTASHVDGEVAAVPTTRFPAQAAPPTAPPEVAFADGAQSAAQWELAVAAAVERIAAGQLDKVVLARDLLVRSPAPIDPRWVLERLAERYPTTWVFTVGGLLGATPEMLVRRDKGLVTSRVLAGTIRRTGDDAKDLALAASLARSSKDLEEHEYAVRSVADALAPHCSSMNVPETPSVLHLANVMHLATDVTGHVSDPVSSLALAASLHPSAAVCGTPTPVAAEVIADLEHMDRGRYAGPVGWTDASGDGEWGIALRCGRYDDADAASLRLFAGCGIVAGSDPAAEVAESDSKLVPMRDALSPEPSPRR